MKYINKAFQENWIAPAGSNIDEFESLLENYYGEGYHVVALNSGTSAIHLGLILLGVQNGDEVLVQSHTHVASVNPVLYLGAKPVFIDSENETWNLCPNYLEDAIKNRLNAGIKPKAIITVDLYGMPYKSAEIKYLSTKYDIPILEDAAEALGSEYQNQKCGTLGEIGVISFNGNKILTTSSGGVIIVKDKKLKEKALYLANQSKQSYPYFQHSEVGYNYRMSNICAGIGCGQLAVLDERLLKRKQNHEFYADIFKDIEDVKMQNAVNHDYKSNYWVNNIILDNKKPEDLRLFLEQHNIESRRLWKPMHLQPLFKAEKYFGGQNSEKLFSTGLCLPSGSNLSEIEKQRIKSSIRSFFNLKF